VSFFTASVANNELVISALLKGLDMLPRKVEFVDPIIVEGVVAQDR
jgi:hypothetical protein